MELKHMLEELHAAGLTDAAIGEQVGTTQGTINRLRHGVAFTTKFDIGLLITALYRAKIAARKHAAHGRDHRISPE